MAAFEDPLLNPAPEALSTSGKNPLAILLLDTERSWRGGQRQVLLLAQGLTRGGHRVSLLCPPDSALRRRSEEIGIPVQPFKVRGEWDVSSLGRLRDEVRHGAFDLLHAHTSHAHGLALLALRSQASAPPLVVTRRVDFPVGRTPWGRWKYGDAVARFVAISWAVARVLERGGVSKDRIHLVYSGVPDLPSPSRDRLTTRAEWGILPRHPLVLWVGHLADHKDPHTFLRALPLLQCAQPRLRVWVVGSGELLSSSQALARRLGLGEVVQFLGARRDIPELLNAADLLVISSHLEGLSTTALDAALARLPVVATEAGGLSEAVLQGRTGLLVPPRDPDALAAAAAAILADPERARIMGKEGRARVLHDFSVEAMVEGNLAAYRSALGQHIY